LCMAQERDVLLAQFSPPIIHTSSIMTRKNAADRDSSTIRKLSHSPPKGKGSQHPPPHHQHKHKEEHRTGTGEYLRDGIYGGLDGIITTFGCVSGVAGAELSCWLALILGLANLVADGLSMAVGNYIGTKSEIEFERKERQREEEEVDLYPEEERDEIREIYYNKGFRGANLEMVVDVICSNRKVWIDTMMVEECGILPEERDPIRAATVTFLSFNIAGAIPLLVYVAALYFPSVVPIAYELCVFVTLCAIFALGAIKGFVAGTWWLKSGIEMLLLGSIAAGAAYYIGFVLHSIDSN